MQPFLRWNALAIVLTITIGGIVSAQTDKVPTATKVGMVNFALVVKKFRKFNFAEAALQSELAPLKDDADKLKFFMKQHQDYLERPTKDQAQIEKSTKALNDGQRALEDLDAKARKLVAKHHELDFAANYKEIRETIEAFANENGYSILFTYSHLPKETLAFEDVSRRVNAADMGAIVPFYTERGFDVTDQIISRLNRSVAPISGN